LRGRRYSAVLAVEYVRAVLGLSRSFRSSARGQKLVQQTDIANGRCCGNEVTRCKAVRGLYNATTQLAAVTLTSDPLTLKLVHGVLVSQGPFLPSLVFVGLFVFPLGGGTGQTDRRTGSTRDGSSF